MKKSFLIFLCILFASFVACSTPQKNKIENQNIDNLVAINLENLDKNYSDETLKALSVILRTNLTIKNSEETDITPQEKYLSIAKQTKNKILKNQNNNIIEISLENNKEYTWQKSIKKSSLLEFALKNNINLSNLSNIEPITENEKVKGINIGNKYFEYEKLAKEFGLESNIIESIENNKKEVVIKGKNKGFYNYFDIEKSEQLSNNNQSYEQILKTFFNDLKIN